GYLAELADVAGRATVADVLVAVDQEGTLVGGIAYVPGPGPLAWFDAPDQAGLRMLAVAPHAQGRGVGGALVAAGVDRAAVEGGVVAEGRRIDVVTGGVVVVAGAMVVVSGGAVVATVPVDGGLVVTTTGGRVVAVVPIVPGSAGAAVVVVASTVVDVDSVAA